MRLYCSKNKDESKQYDCIKAGNLMLLDLGIVQETGMHSFSIRPQKQECCIEPDDYYHSLGTAGCIEPCNQNYRPHAISGCMPS